MKYLYLLMSNDSREIWGHYICESGGAQPPVAYFKVNRQDTPGCFNSLPTVVSERTILYKEILPVLINIPELNGLDYTIAKCKMPNNESFEEFEKTVKAYNKTKKIADCIII